MQSDIAKRAQIREAALKRDRVCVYHSTTRLRAIGKVA